MSLIPTWPIAVGALVVGLVVGLAAGAFADHTIMSAKVARLEAAAAKLESARAAQYTALQTAARTKEQEWAVKAGQVEQEKTNAIIDINARHAVELDGLRKRAERKPPATGGMPQAASACEGSTGAELSRPDSEFLAGIAARADTHRAALAACYGAYDALK